MVEPDFKALQYAFTAHLRAPHQHPVPGGVAPERMAVYRELVYRNVEDCMAHAFPVLRSVMADASWHAMIGDYFSEHRAQSPLFPRMAQEFLGYLATRDPDPKWPPFLLELAQYEWLEADVLFDPRAIAEVGIDAEVDVLDGCVVPNPVLRAAVYRFPVHRISRAYQPREVPAVPTYLVVFRRRDDSAGLLELNVVAARLLELILAEDGRPARALLEAIRAELKHSQAAAVIAGGRDILQTFLDCDIVLGARAHSVAR